MARKHPERGRSRCQSAARTGPQLSFAASSSPGGWPRLAKLNKSAADGLHDFDSPIELIIVGSYMASILSIFYTTKEPN